jgi:hypothetical protein
VDSQGEPGGFLEDPVSQLSSNSPFITSFHDGGSIFFVWPMNFSIFSCLAFEINYQIHQVQHSSFTTLIPKLVVIGQNLIISTRVTSV